MENCIISGCAEKSIAKGFCKSHYSKQYNDKTKQQRKDYYKDHYQEHKEYWKENAIKTWESRRNNILLDTYNITLAQYREMFEKQGGKCYICGLHQTKLKRALGVDHNHSCCPGKKSCGKCIRKLLCSSCNNAIGALRDSPELLRKSAIYVEEHVVLENKV